MPDEKPEHTKSRFTPQGVMAVCALVALPLWVASILIAFRSLQETHKANAAAAQAAQRLQASEISFQEIHPLNGFSELLIQNLNHSPITDITAVFSQGFQDTNVAYFQEPIAGCSSFEVHQENGAGVAIDLPPGEPRLEFDDTQSPPSTGR